MEIEEHVEGNEVQDVVADLENEQVFGGAENDMDYVVQLQNEQQVHANDAADAANDIEMIGINMEFAVRLTRSNVNNSTNGVVSFTVLLSKSSIYINIYCRLSF